MNNPYYYELKKLKNEEVNIDRAGASTVTGKVKEIKQSGCVITVDEGHDDHSRFVFIAYEDIRGVGYIAIDYNKIDPH